MAALAGDISVFTDAIWSAGTALTQAPRRRRIAQPADVSVAVGEDALTLTAPAWRELEERGGAATPFQTLAMAEQTVAAHLRRGETPRIVLVREAGRPAAILPLVCSRWCGIPITRFLGDPLIQYGDAIAAPEVSSSHLQAAWLAAIAASRGRLLYLRKVREDARIAPILLREARLIAEYDAPFVETSRTAGLPEFERNRERRRKRLEKIGEFGFETLQGTEAASAIREALDIKREWLTERGMSSAVVGDADWEHALAALAHDGSARVDVRAARLTVGGESAAIEIALVHGERWYAFLGAVSPRFAKASPGHLQTAETIAACRTAGVSTYDLLAPADPYKLRIAHDSITVRDFAPATAIAGRLGLLAARALPAAKGVLARLPSPLRRMLAAGRSSR